MYESSVDKRRPGQCLPRPKLLMNPAYSMISCLPVGETDTDRKKETERERERERASARARVCVCVRMSVW